MSSTPSQPQYPFFPTFSVILFLTFILLTALHPHRAAASAVPPARRRRNRLRSNRNQNLVHTLPRFAPQVGRGSKDTDCENFSVQQTDLTIFELVQQLNQKRVSRLTYDKNGGNYNVFTNLLLDTNLQNLLSNPEKRLTLFIPNDLSANTTAQDIQRVFKLHGKLRDEVDIHRIISKKLPRQYAEPVFVRAAVVRHHIVEEKLAYCDVWEQIRWRTWANQTVLRFGISLVTGTDDYHNAELVPIPPFECSNGFVYLIDRLIMPDLSAFARAPPPSPTPSKTPRPSTSPSPGALLSPSASPDIARQTPSGSPRPSKAAPTSPPAKSTTPLPKVNDPLEPYNTKSPSPTPPPRNDDPDAQNSSRGNSPAVCFPAHMRVLLEDGGWRRMDDLEIGMRVRTRGGGVSEVMGFSHRDSSQWRRHEFVRVETRNGRHVELSSSHLLYVNGELRAAGKAEVGDVVETTEGVSEIVGVERVWRTGLFAPHTLTGSVVVEGVTASCYTTAVREGTAHSLLSAVRTGWRLGLVGKQRLNPLGGWLDHGVGERLLSAVLRVASSPTA